MQDASAQILVTTRCIIQSFSKCSLANRRRGWTAVQFCIFRYGHFLEEFSLQGMKPPPPHYGQKRNQSTGYEPVWGPEVCLSEAWIGRWSAARLTPPVSEPRPGTPSYILLSVDSAFVHASTYQSSFSRANQMAGGVLRRGGGCVNRVCGHCPPPAKWYALGRSWTAGLSVGFRCGGAGSTG